MLSQNSQGKGSYCRLDRVRAHGKWRKTRLILFTDTTLDAVTILRHYNLRWPIDRGLTKSKPGWTRQLWPRKREALCRWLNIQLMTYALLQLLTVRAGKLARSTVNQSWCSEDVITAGMVRIGLKEILSELNVRSCCDYKFEIFQFPDIENIPKSESSMPKVV